MQMKKLIVCPKKSGNTHKVCSYAAAQSGAALHVAGREEKTDLPQYDAVVLASGVYGGQAHKNILNWVRGGAMDALKPDVKIYVLLTWFGRKGSDRDAFEDINRALAEKGRKAEEDYMTCFGRGMIFIRAFHPNEEDMKNVLEWVKKLG
jgi:flavodoxin